MASSTNERLRGLQQALAAGRVVLLDGGLATELEKDPRVTLADSGLWSAALLLERNAHLQSVVTNAHTEYFLAGADVATTVSYQASADGFRREGVDDRAAVERLFARSVELAVEARDVAWAQLQQQSANGRLKPLVGASIGCYGAALGDGSEYRGDYGKTKDELVAWHRERFAFFVACPGADFLVCETIPSLVEVEAFVELLNEQPAAHAMLAVACRSESELNDGSPIARVAAVLAQLKNPSQLLAVGINCTPPHFVEGLLRNLDVPFPKVAYPNSGECWDGLAKQWLPATATGAPSSWDEYLPKWHAAGARVFGGCCRTSPADISVMRAHFEQ